MVVKAPLSCTPLVPLLGVAEGVDANGGRKAGQPAIAEWG